MPEDVENALNNLRRELFGPNVPVPRAYIDALLHLTEHASARVGVTRSDTDIVVYWLDGHVLGQLSCHGVSDDETTIEGRLIRLTELATMKLAIAVEYDDFTRVSRIGRVLTLAEASDADQIVLDATPRSATSERLQATERFIDELLAAYARA